MTIDIVKGEDVGCATVRRNLMCLCLLATLTAAAPGCGNAPPSSAPKSDQPVPSAGGPSAAKPSSEPLPKADLTMTAEELAKGYADEAEGDKKYKDKTIRVQGVLERVEKDSVGVTVVILKGDGKLVISCGIRADSVDTAKALKAGQSVTIQGTCLFGRLGDEVTLGGCIIGGE